MSCLEHVNGVAAHEEVAYVDSEVAWQSRIYLYYKIKTCWKFLHLDVKKHEVMHLICIKRYHVIQTCDLATPLFF